MEGRHVDSSQGMHARTAAPVAPPPVAPAPPAPPAGAHAFAAAAAAIDRVVAIAVPHVHGLFDAVAPTPAFLHALAGEVRRAQQSPRSVPHPELADPQVYWERSAWPQALAVVKKARAALVEVAEQVAPIVTQGETVIGGWLRTYMETHDSARAADPEATRNEAVDGIAQRCEALHRTVERLLAIAPTFDAVEAARREADALREAAAARDVHEQRGEMRRRHADVDDEAFDRWWSDTERDHVAVRDAQLRSAPPFRHVDLAIVAHEQARHTVARDVQAMIDELTAPILAIGKKMVSAYDAGAVPPSRTAFPQAPLE